MAKIAAIGSMICFVGECQNGAGKHLWDVDLALFPDLLRWQYAHGILYEQTPPPLSPPSFAARGG